ncbi:MAG: hypothetical protein Q7U40_01220, partial [Desulfatirhabdiaceae bacterium]|nr:hypothetical protein [Desulfatirhabdiaceae bacterium]
LILRFIDRVNSRGRINLQDDLLMNLTKLKMIQNGSPTLAAMLLFGNHGIPSISAVSRRRTRSSMIC